MPADIKQKGGVQRGGVLAQVFFHLPRGRLHIPEQGEAEHCQGHLHRRYHLMYKPPPTMEVQARLLQNPKDSEEQIKLKMDLFYRNSAELEQFYGDAITLNGDQDPYTVFEYIESGIINRLPKKVP